VPRNGERFPGRLLRAVGNVASVGILGICVFFGALWLEHRTELTLPVPTGPYAVGRALSDWGDAATPDPLAPVPGTVRELQMWMWYPAAQPTGRGPHTTSVALADYLPAPTRAAVTHNLGVLLGTFLTHDLGRVRAHSLMEPPVSGAQRAYPVVILRAGAAAGVWTYTSLAEDLASHGYVVVGFDAPYRTQIVAFPDGRVMHRTPANNPELAAGAPDSGQRINRVLSAWMGDIAFALDRLQRLNVGDTSGLSGTGFAAVGRLTGRLDLTRVGLVGHSLGGATALQFCHDDVRCTAGVDIDGAPLGTVVRDGIRRPFLFLLSDHRQDADPENRRILMTIQSLYDRLPPSARALVTLPGANHFLFSDDGALLKSHIVLRVLRTIGVLGLDGRSQLAATATAVRRFLDAHVAGAHAPT